MSNFFNYYGEYEDNIYEFNSGLNVIVADNGAGKTKLFSAFCWILKDEVINSDATGDKNISVDNYKAYMISDKAKHETLTNNEVKCGVRINFSEGQYEYEIEKYFWAKRINDSSPTNPENWFCHSIETKISKKDLVLLDFTLLNSDADEVKKVTDKILRREFLQYALIKGEEVDKIIDFENSDSLKSAIKTITNASKIDNLITLTKTLDNKSDKDLTAAKRANTNNLNEFNAKVKERDDCKTKLDRKKLELERYGEELTKAKKERDRLLNLLATAQKREQIRSDQRHIEINLENIDKEHAEFLNNLNDRFFDNQHVWLFYNTVHYEKGFHSLRDKYLDYQKEKQVLRDFNNNLQDFLTKLPEGSPDSYSLRKMLEEENCFVCGREAERDTQPWKHIESVLQKHIQKEPQASKQNFSKFFDELMQSSSAYYNQINSIASDLNSFRARDKYFREEKLRLRKSSEDMVNDLIGLGGNETDEDKFIVTAFGQAERRIEKNEASIKDCENEIDVIKNKIQALQEQVDNLTEGSTTHTYIERKNILGDILKISEDTKKKMYAKILKNLENKSNEYYHALTLSNTGDGGNIKISSTSAENYSVEIRDDQDNKMYGLSEGFQRMKKLAVIMAIIAISDRGLLDYPLIADAPLSSFGKGFIQGFFEHVPDVFNQTIIMVKDLYDDAQPNSLSEIGEQVLMKIKSGSGSMHINLINEKLPQIFRETVIKRY